MQNAGGFEWFVAWRYLRTRGRRASLVPLVIGLTLIAAAGVCFCLMGKEPPRPILRLGEGVEFRRLFMAAGLAAVLVGLMRATVHVAHWLRHPTQVVDDRWRRVAALATDLAVLTAGAALLYSAETIVGSRRGGWLERDLDLSTAIGAIGTGLGAAGVLAAAVGLVWWRRGAARAVAAWTIAAFALVGVGLLFQWASTRPHQLAAYATLLSNLDWRRVLQAAGLACVLVGGLVTVFSAFFILQSIFTTISTFGVFLGTWALCVALSVMNGFEVDLRQKILGSNAHVLISKEDGAFEDWRGVAQQLDGVPGVRAYTPYVQSEVAIAANSNYSGVIIKGIDPKTVGRVTDLEKNLQKGSKLSQLWPLADDGGPIEYTHRMDGGPIEVPGGQDDAGPNDTPPPDFSGGGDEADAGPPGSTVENDAPPPDFSGGADDTDAGEGDEDIDADLEPDAAPLQHHVHDRFFDHEPDLIDLSAGMPTVLTSPGRDLMDHPLDARVAALDGILVGRELARNLHLYVGEEVQVVSPIAQDTPTGQVPRVRSFRVAGIFFSGMYEYDTKYAYVTVPALQSFLGMGDDVNGIEVKVAHLDETGPVVRAIEKRLGDGYRVQDWKEINRSLFSALKLEKIAMFLVLTIIILVASFSIVSNLIMIVVEKAREIAILKAQGASDRGVMRVFMIEGLYIGSLGTLVGVCLGVFTCWALDTFGLPLDPDVYYIDKLPVSMDAVAIALVGFAGVAISFIATIYPSFLAARMRPVDGLRYE